MRIHEFITEAAYDSAIDAMKRAYPDRVADIDTQVKWAKAVLKKQDRIVWWLRIIGAFLGGKLDSKLLGDYNFTDTAQLQQDIGHFYGFEFAPIEKYIFQRQPVSQVIADLSLLEQQWKEKNKAAAGVTVKKGDYQLFQFGDGTSWWFVNRAYCADEGRSGQHCGNVTGKTEKDQRILSLRTPANNVILTFILGSNGLLGEMKAKGNQKPQEKYHPHIMKLLMWDKVTGISGMGFLSEMNFSVFDLSDDNLQMIYAAKPILLKTQLKVTPEDILAAPAFVRADDELMRIAITKRPGLSKLMTGTEVVTSIPAWEEAIASDPELILSAPESVPNYQQRVMDIIKDDRTLLMRAPTTLRNDYAFMHELLTATPSIIASVVPTTRRYNDLAKTAVRAGGRSLADIPEDLRTAELCEIAVASDGYALRAVPKTLATPKMYKIAVSHVGKALKYVPENMRTKELCMIAVAKDGAALGAVPVALLDDKMMIAAVGSSPDALMSIPKSQHTTELCMAAVKHNGMALAYANKQAITKEMCSIAMGNGGAGALAAVPGKWKTPEICLSSVSKYGTMLEYVPDRVMSVQLCAAAVADDSNALVHVPRELKTREICLDSVSRRGMMLAYVPKEIQDTKLCNAAVSNDGQSMVYVRDDLLSTDMCMKAIKAGGDILTWIPEEFKTLPVCIAASKRNPASIRHVPDELRDKVKQELGLKESTRYAVVKSISESAHISEFKHISARSAYASATRGMIVINETGKIVNHSGNEILGKTYFISR